MTSWRPAVAAVRMSMGILALSFPANAGTVPQPRADLPAFILSGGRLTAPELSALHGGRIVAKVIETEDRSEVLSFAATRVRATPSRVLDRFRTVEQWRRDPWVLGLGRIGSTPTSHDFDGFALDAGEVKDLARCRLHKCEIRLPAEAIERFRNSINWSSPSPAADATEMFRQTLASYAGSYLGRGNEALFEYANNDDPVHIADGLRQIVTRSSFIGTAAPDLYAYLDDFPRERPSDAEDFLYWLKEKFWVTDVVSLNHSTVVDRTTSSGRMILAISKQLYANHYYEAAISLTAYVEGPTGESYLVSLNRARADVRRSGFNWIERLLLNRLVRNRIESQLAYLKQRLENS
jgi:hypothetical protein